MKILYFYVVTKQLKETIKCKNKKNLGQLYHVYSSDTKFFTRFFFYNLI